MILFNRLAAAMLAAAMTSSPAFAQDDRQEIEFAGGTLSVAKDGWERVLSFDGRELHRAYFIGVDRIVTVQDTDVAIFEAGNGGNACGAYPIMVWQREGGDIEAAITGEDCGAPPPAVANDRIYFVPYLRPGEETTMQAWTPDDGFQTAGTIAFAPQTGTDWSTFDAQAIGHPVDLFRNAAIYRAAEALLGEELFSVATGLLVAGAPEVDAEGLLTAQGCVPHACGAADTFIVVDPRNEKLYFAQKQPEPQPRLWPARWPDALLAKLPADFRP